MGIQSHLYSPRAKTDTIASNPRTLLPRKPRSQAKEMFPAGIPQGQNSYTWQRVHAANGAARLNQHKTARERIIAVLMPAARDVRTVPGLDGWLSSAECTS